MDRDLRMDNTRSTKDRLDCGPRTVFEREGEALGGVGGGGGRITHPRHVLFWSER